MRLTLDMIRRAPQFTNTLQQREIDLRGLGLTVLDERPLLLLNDSFDVLNLSQNPLVRLDYFPGSSGAVLGGVVEPAKGMMLRLQSLVVHRNRLSHVSEAACAALLPNLRAFLADHNEFRELRDLLFLSQWRHLEILSLEHNPVTLHEGEERLRAFAVYLCPKLKLVNYQRVTKVDRHNVETMRTEFRQLVNEWRQLGKLGQSNTNINGGGKNSEVEASSIDGGGLISGKKIRKRGREARAAAASNLNNIGDSLGGVMPAATDPSSSGTATFCDMPGDADTTQARLEALESKMAAAETEEELMEIQQEILELEEAAKRQQAAKSKRARTS